MGLASGDSGGVGHQFIPFSAKKTLSSTGRMFRIIILHEAVIMWIKSSNKWHKKLIKDVAVKFCIHQSIKDTRFSGSIPANSSAHINFCGMFGVGFIARFSVPSFGSRIYDATPSAPMSRHSK